MNDKKEVSFGRFVWHDLISNDRTAAVNFYSQLVGWTIDEDEFAPGKVYQMINAGGTQIGGFMDLPEPNVPNHWVGYVQVEELESTIQRVESNGGKLLNPIVTIPNVGRIVPFADPTGGVVAAFEPIKAMTVPNDFRPPLATFCWNELLTNDVEQAKAFYTEVFGWQAENNDMGGFPYTIFSTDGFMVAGLMAAPETMGGQSAWLSHIYVESVSETIDRAKALGATLVMPPQQIPIGSFALLKDPVGAHVFVFEPSADMPM